MIAALCATLLLGLQLPTAEPSSTTTTPVAQAGAESRRILVVPFETPGRDGRTYWLGEGVALLLADDINARGLGAITRTVRERAYEQLHLPASAVLSRATVIKVGEIVGAAQVIVGEVTLDGDALSVSARSIRIDVGRADSEIVERGSLSDLFAVARRVARRAAPGGSEAAVTPTPLPQAFEQFVRGVVAEQPATRASFLEAALKLEPGYDRARIELWQARMDQAEYAQALAAVRDVAAGSPYGRRARFLSGVSLISLQKYDEAFALYKELQAAAPAATILNNLGVVQLRRNAPAEEGKPVYFFTEAAKAAPNDPDVLFNLGYAYALDRDPQGAIYWLREALRRDPTDADAHFVLAAALDTAGNTAEAGRERELAAQLAARYADPAGRRDSLPKGLARIEQDLESWRASGIDQAMTSTTQRDQRELVQFHVERGQRLFDAEQDRDAVNELRRAIFLSPYDADAHLLLGRIHLRGGRPRDAVAALEISLWSRETAAAHVALAEAFLRLKDLAAAKRHAQKAIAMDPSSADARSLLDRIERGGQS
jgi:tetratricopeptide (TPR) repeat protein